MKTTIKITNKKKFNKLVESADCSKMTGYTGSVTIDLKNGKKPTFNKLHKYSAFKEKYGFIFAIEGDIFDRLNESNICYSVGVAMVWFKSKGSGINGKDFYIIAAKKDENKLKSIGLGFGDSRDHDTIERTLNDNEIAIFKSIQDDFIKVTQNNDGRVYELKYNSFKEYYNTVCKTVSAKAKIKYGETVKR